MRIQEIQKRVERIQFHSFPASVLREMEERVVAEQAELTRRALALEERINESLREGKPANLDLIRKRIRQLARTEQEFEEERKRIRDAYQERTVRERLAAKLGGERRVKFLDFVVVTLIFVVLGLLLFEMLTPDLDAGTRFIISIVDTVCCLIFLTDFFVRLSLADSRAWYWRNHWIDFITSIPIPDLELLRMGRVARVARIVRVLRLLRALRIFFMFWRGLDKLQNIFDVRLMKRSLILGFFVMLAGAFIIYYTEGRHRAVESFGESFWWSLTTLLTAGFADLHNPTTAAGRMLTVVLIITGMIVVGVFTATLTSLYVGDDSDDLALKQKSMEAKLDAILNRLDRLSPPPGAPESSSAESGPEDEISSGGSMPPSR